MDRPDATDRLKQEVRQIWDQNADYWDERMGEGNHFHRLLIEPAQLRALELKGGETVLDADPTRFFDLVFREIPPALVCRMRLTAAESGVT